MAHDNKPYKSYLFFTSLAVNALLLITIQEISGAAYPTGRTGQHSNIFGLFPVKIAN